MFCSISSAISAHESMETHEAASSTPSGKPSTSLQMRRASSVARRRRARSPARPGVARSTKRRSAPELPSPFSARPRPCDVEHPLALHVQALARRGQQLDVRRALDDLREQVGALDEVLEVVEHEQRRPLAQIVEELLLRREAAVNSVNVELERLGYRRHQELRRRHRDEGDEVHAVWIALDPAPCSLEREPRLACTARSYERQQAAVGILEQPVDFVELRRAADERRARRRQVLHARLDRLQQREVAWETCDLELVDALRGAEILEPVHAQVADVCVHERTGRLREKHLPAVADGGYPRALVHVEADVSLLGEPRLPGMQPHPHANRPLGECALAVRSGGNCARRTGERNEERITLRVDLDALVLGKRRPEPPPMLVQCLPVVVAELVQQSRRALDVGEHQGHDAGWEVMRHRAPSWSSTDPLSIRLARSPARQASSALRAADRAVRAYAGLPSSSSMRCIAAARALRPLRGRM